MSPTPKTPLNAMVRRLPWLAGISAAALVVVCNGLDPARGADPQTASVVGGPQEIEPDSNGRIPVQDGVIGFDDTGEVAVPDDTDTDSVPEDSDTDVEDPGPITDGSAAWGAGELGGFHCQSVPAAPLGITGLLGLALALLRRRR